MHISKLFAVVCLFFAFSLSAEVIGPWNLDTLFKAPRWELSDVAPEEGLKGILFDSIPYSGKRVQVFAYYGVPEGDTPEGGWPAVVCVHGGGGTAFAQWVKLWNSHGYAAISMDLEGHYPLRINGEKKGPRISTEYPGPERVGVFNDYAMPIEKQWYKHAVSQVLLAHSLLRSFPEVNADKTGVTGISWGGTLTSTTMGIDDRFKFAIPVYGCGFLPDSDGHQGDAIKPGKHSEVVFENYDGSAYFKNVKIPTFWVNGTNDKHFSMPITQLSSNTVKGKSLIRFELEMRHGHGAGWRPKEIYAFADSIVNGGDPLPVLSDPKLKKGVLKSSVKLTGEVVAAKLLYTLEGGVWPGRKWQEIDAIVTGEKLSAEVPEGATAAYFNVTDSRGFMTSSEFVEIK